MSDLEMTDLEKLRGMAKNFDAAERKVVLSCIPVVEILEYVTVVFEDMESKHEKIAEMLGKERE